jgi:hypothetical protein
MTGTEFREGHGDPANWGDDEYEAYFAWTAPEQPAPTTADYQPAA